MTTTPPQPPTPSQDPGDPAATEATLGELFTFNGVDATTGEYLLPPMDVRQLARVATGTHLERDEVGDLKSKRRAALKANYAVVEGVDPNDLAQAGWAVVFPQIVDDPDAAERQAAIRAALAPLLAHRRAQATAGGANLYREYAGELGYRAGETKQQYLNRLGAGPGPARPTKVPYYLLLVAAPEEIPFGVQYQLDVHYAVGRIAFDTIDEYARYAQSVVDAETGRAPRPRRAAFFSVANPGDTSTRLSCDHLVRPLAAHVEGNYAQRGWTVDRHLAEAATRGRLTELLSDPPALLFTASHGVGLPVGDRGQRDLQGALLCQDWAGPGHPVKRAHYFAGEDLPAGADLRGMIAVLFACYGGGTPARDEFTRRTLGEAKADTLAASPLIARLPQRMLSHPGGGALAVVAHVDRAWASTFLWMDAKGTGKTTKHLDVFESMLDSVLVGKRLGYAMEAFNLRYAELAADLAERIEQIHLYDQHYEDSELAHMWLYNNDARNYAVLGDPAVFLANTGAPTRSHAAPAPVQQPPVQQPPVQQQLVQPPAPRPDAAAPTGADAGQPAQAVPSFGWFRKDSDGDGKTVDDAEGEGREPGFMARLGNKLSEVLSGVLADAAVLEVKTYTAGDLHAVAGGTALPESGAHLRAYTRCELDGDIQACVPMTPDGGVDAALWAVHLEMVKQAQAHRAELIRIVLSVFSSKVK